MKKRLVPLKMHDYLEDIVIYIAKMAEPGAIVFFLVHRPVNALKWLQISQLLTGKKPPRASGDLLFTRGVYQVTSVWFRGRATKARV